MELRAILGFVGTLLLTSCGAPSGAKAPGGDAAGAGLPADPNCRSAAPGPDARCMQECGPPVAREDEPPPPYRWFTADEAKNRESYGCPRCLDGSTAIATPSGEARVDTLRVGDLVWTESPQGERVEALVVRVARVPVPSSHRLVALRLADGRQVRVSAGHPLAVEGVVGDLGVGSMLDGAQVVGREEVSPERAFTFDVLPAGTTGRYWADGIRLRSTLSGEAR